MGWENTDQPAWGKLAPAAAIMAAGLVVAGGIVVLRPIRLGVAGTALSIAIAIAMIVVVARCRMPQLIKAGLLVVGVAVATGVVAMQDIAGLRAVRGETITAIDEVGLPSGPIAPPRARIGSDDPAADAVAREVVVAVEPALRAANLNVDATLSQATPGKLRFNWSLERAGQEVWCGFVTTTASPGRAQAALAERIATAAARSVPGTLDCAP